MTIPAQNRIDTLQHIPLQGILRALRVSSSQAAMALALLGIGAAAILLRFPPAEYSFYPQCPIHNLLGILCPGCGTTRALSALLHGQLVQAMHLNPFTTLLVPVAPAWLIYTRTRHRALTPPSPVLYALLTIAAIFTVARNL